MSGLEGLLRCPRYEVIPARGTEEAVAERVPAGMTVTVTASPVKGLEPTIELAERLAARGYRVVPHLAARSVAELLTQMIGAVVVVCVGLAIGWRVHTNAADVTAAFALALLFGYAFTWAGICLGMTLRSPEAAQQTGFIIFLPLIFISCAFVPIQGMPGWLQPVAEWNPMSAIATACRKLFGNPNPAAAIPSWPMQHPELAVLAWSAAMLVVFAPLAVQLYRRKALG